MITLNTDSKGIADMDKMPDISERVLVCLSPSPSNKKVVAAAVKMAEAFNAVLSAVYVRPAGSDTLPEKDRKRLQDNIAYAEKNGASVTTVIGDDVPEQIAEYAHISGATKIVVGQSGAKRRHFWSKASLTEQIIINAPDVDVYIIPDSSADSRQHRKKIYPSYGIRPSLKDMIITILLLAAATGVGLIFNAFGFSEANIITVFILCVLVISVTTVSPIYSAAGSLASVLLFNWFFIEPRFSFHTYETEYAVTFVIMLISSLITGTLAIRLKANSRQAAREAFRAKVLFDTNQLLQKAETPAAVIGITARQIITLLDRDVVVYPIEETGRIGSGTAFNALRSPEDDTAPDDNEEEIIRWSIENTASAGFGFENHKTARSQYHPISINDHCFGAISVHLGGKPLEPFESSVLMSILGECALALENLQNAAEKESASVKARNEKLRSDLLRSISHDIRTPLTSISGNASNLISHYDQLDDTTLKQIFNDIYDDSEWLIDLVENLLSISRIENGQMELHLSADVLNDAVEEALKHIDRNAEKHTLKVEDSGELLLVRMDSRLIMQVIINLINNAVKNTPDGSEIRVISEKSGTEARVTVSDNGPGIPDDIKEHVFDMFYTGNTITSDSRRGLGLGLALCRSIIEAHGGTITLTDNEPSGCRFTFSLPAREVNIDEQTDDPGN